MYNSLDKEKPSLTVFLDLAKAFDTGDHKTIIGGLAESGNTGQRL